MAHRAKTKRRRKKKKHAELWDKFDVVCGAPPAPLECVYSGSGLREFCDACGSAVAWGDDQFLTCTNSRCCLIYKDSLDHSAEWRYYGADDSHSVNPTRCGMPVNELLKESSYGCKVMCPMSATYEMKKIRRYTEWQAMPYKEKSQYDEFQRIKMMSKAAGIPKIIIDDALRTHKQISEMRTFRGCNRHGIIAASVYIGSRMNNYPRTPKEIATIFKLDNTAATKGCKNAVHLLNQIEKNKPNNEKTRFSQTRPIDFIERYCSRLSMNHELTKVCQFVALRIQRYALMPENTPHSVAAGIIYFVAQTCGLNISKQDVNRVSEISEVTVNKCFKKLRRLRKDLIPSIILEKYADKP